MNAPEMMMMGRRRMVVIRRRRMVVMRRRRMSRMTVRVAEPCRSDSRLVRATGCSAAARCPSCSAR